MQKKIIKINGIPYYETNGAVLRVRDNPEVYDSIKENAERNLGAAFKDEVKDASDTRDRLST